MYSDNCRCRVKDEYLRKFQEKGFYLIDAIDEPINDKKEKDRNKKIKQNLENKIRDIENEKLISTRTSIFLIKKNIFEIFEPELKRRGFNVVHNEFLPFPSNGHQPKFKEKFKNYLLKAHNFCD